VGDAWRRTRSVDPRERCPQSRTGLITRTLTSLGYRHSVCCSRECRAFDGAAIVGVPATALNIFDFCLPLDAVRSCSSRNTVVYVPSIQRPAISQANGAHRLRCSDGVRRLNRQVIGRPWADSTNAGVITRTKVVNRVVKSFLENVSFDFFSTLVCYGVMLKYFSRRKTLVAFELVT
jgi:hypothetical protein